MVDRTKEKLNGAVATTRGWVNPKTGELLVSIRGLPNAISWTKGPIEMAKDPEPEVETPTVDQTVPQSEGLPEPEIVAPAIQTTEDVKDAVHSTPDVTETVQKAEAPKVVKPPKVAKTAKAVKTPKAKKSTNKKAAE